MKNRGRLHPGWLTEELTVSVCTFRELASSHRLSTEDKIKRLNDYFSTSIDVILANGGQIVKYIGPGILCYWNATEKQEHHAIRACQCALQQHSRIQAINSKLSADRQMTANIGISTGPCTVGYFGSENELHFDIFGESLNIACELISDNFKDLSIVISEDTFSRIRNNFVVTRLGNFQIKGQDYPIAIYEIRAI